MVPFAETLKKYRLEVTRRPLETLQINVGKLCDLACLHCHVEAGPKRTEVMEKKTIDRVLELLDRTEGIHTVDITGGAPELNPHFRYLVQEARERDKEVIDRCNLTVFYQKGLEETPSFLKDHKVQIIASLPCYSRDNVDRQRGRGVFDDSIRALKQLNELGYGREGTDLILDLVHNPVGPFLPPSQEELEADYKKELGRLFGITFNRLYTITNMPIKRFLRQLEREGQCEEYMNLLVSGFNPQAALGVMCRNLISVGWDGLLYDCDFNQMLEIPVGGKRRTIWEIESFNQFSFGPIAFDDHCYGCTAGAGSSCGGALTPFDSPFQSG